MPDQLTPSAPSLGQMYLDQVQNGGSPTAVPPQDNAPAPVPANGQGAQPVSPTPPTNPASAAPSPAPAADPIAAKHQAVGRFFQTLVGSGSGSSASQLFRSLVGGAILGMDAGGSDPVVARGPNGDIRDRSISGAAGRGFAAGGGYAQQQQDRAQAQANAAQAQKRANTETQIQSDDLMLRKAADARAQLNSIQAAQEHEKRMRLLDQSIAAGNWQAAQRATETAENQVKFFNALQEVGAQPLADSDGQTFQFRTLLDAEKAAHDNPKFFIGNFQTRAAYNPEDGKYEVYRVPDSDLKNVQLKDPVSGQIHTIPRMHVADYLDFLTRVQNLKKGRLTTEEASTELNRLQLQLHDEDQYGSALNGDLDYGKLSPRDRAALYNRASKDAQNAMRSRSAAQDHLSKLTQNLAGSDPQEISDARDQLQEATELSKTYGNVLSRLHGNPQPSPVSPNVQKAVSAIAHLPKDQQQKQIDSSSLTAEEKAAAKKALGL